MQNFTTKFVVASFLLFIAFASPPVSAQDADKDLVENRLRTVEKLFDEAAKKCKERDYREGVLDLLALLNTYQEFVKFDQAAHLLGGALYELEYLEASDRVYRYLLKSVLKSPYVPNAILGLQKVYYHKGEYQQSLKFYNALESHYASHAVIDEARYYALQANYQLHNYSFVINTVKHIHRGNDFYPFSLYTAALTDLKKKMFDRPSPLLSMSARPRPKAASYTI